MGREGALHPWHGRQWELVLPGLGSPFWEDSVTVIPKENAMRSGQRV